jgi:hypothetical protein
VQIGRIEHDHLTNHVHGTHITAASADGRHP